MQGRTGVRDRRVRQRVSHRLLATSTTALVLGLTLSACGPDTMGVTSAPPSAPVVGAVSPTGAAGDADTQAGDPASGPIPTVTADPLSPDRQTTTMPPAPVTPTTAPATTGTPTGVPTGAPTTVTVTATPTGAVLPGDGSCARTLPAYPVLVPGARGAAVGALQCFLDDAGYGPVTVDGVYGTQTRAAVRRLEASLEGPPAHPGRIDAGTWVTLIARTLGDGTLEMGSSGPHVVTLQRALRAAGATVTVDGRFGAQTKKAVQRLQDANRVGADGVVRGETLFLLKMGATIG